jgi:hypothetical protein
MTMDVLRIGRQAFARLMPGLPHPGRHAAARENFEITIFFIISAAAM